MAEVVRMPKMSDTMTEGVLVRWLKEVGSGVSSGDILAEVETDKATMELEAYEEGTLLYCVKAGGKVPVDAVIAIIGEKESPTRRCSKQTRAQKGSLAGVRGTRGTSEAASGTYGTHKRSVVLCFIGPGGRQRGTDKNIALGAVFGTRGGLRSLRYCGHGAQRTGHQARCGAVQPCPGTSGA